MPNHKHLQCLLSPTRASHPTTSACNGGSGSTHWLDSEVAISAQYPSVWRSTTSAATSTTATHKGAGGYGTQSKHSHASVLANWDWNFRNFERHTTKQPRSLGDWF